MNTGSQANKGKKYTTRIFWFGWFLWILGIGLLALTIIYGYMDTMSELANHGTARATSSAFFYIVILVVLFVSLIGLFIFLITRKKVRVELFPDFMLISQRKNNWKLLYQDISDIFQSERTTWMGVLPIRKGKIILHTDRGSALLTSSIGRYDQMVNEIEGFVFPLIHAKYQKELDLGKSVHFNDFTLNKSGFTYRNQVSFWSDIGQYTVNNGILHFEINQETGKQMVKVPVEKIPNLPLLLRFLDDYTR